MIQDESCESEGKTDQARPQTSSQRTVMEMWSSILGVEGIGVHDNFVDLGGDSISATLFLHQIREKFQVEIPFAMLFDDHATVADIAKAIDSMRPKNRT